MATSKRIVLVDPLGEVLFSGESLVASGERLVASRAEEACPETKRSAESGVFRAADVFRAGDSSVHDDQDEQPVEDEVEVEAENADPDAEIATKKRGPRAA